MGKRGRERHPHPPHEPEETRRRIALPETRTPARIHQLDDRKAAMEREIQILLLDNHRLAAAHVALKQDIDAVNHELRRLSAAAAADKADRDAEVGEVYEKARRMEADARAVDDLTVELARVREDIQNFSAERKELTVKLLDLEDDLVRVRSELQQFPVIKGELDLMHKEVQRGRAAVDYEKKMQASNLEYSQAMEKHKIIMAAEIEKLQAELANAEKRARAAAAAAAAAAPSNSNHQFAATTSSFAYSANYGNPEAGYGVNMYPAAYAVHQGSADASSQYGPAALPYGSLGPYDMKQPYAHP